MEYTHKNMAIRLIVARGLTEDRDETEREIDHSMNPMIAMTDALVDIAVDALRELAELRGTTAEAILMDLVGRRLELAHHVPLINHQAVRGPTGQRRFQRMTRRQIARPNSTRCPVSKARNRPCRASCAYRPDSVPSSSIVRTISA